MATNRRAPRDDEGDVEGLESSTFMLEEVRPESQQPTQVFFPAVPNYATDRRFDVRARDYNNCIKLPYKDGYREKFNLIADPGYYFEELRAGNKIVGDNGVILVAPGMSSAASPPAAQTTQAQAVQPSAERSSARSINDTTETIRATKELLKEVAPPTQTAAPLTAEDVARIAEQAALKVAEQMRAAQPSAPAQQNTLATVREYLDFLKENTPPAPQPTQQQQTNPDLLLLDAILKRSSVLDEALGNIVELANKDEPDPWYARLAERVVDVVSESAAPVLTPIIGHYMQRLITPVEPAPVGPQEQQQPSNVTRLEQPNRQEAFERAWQSVFRDMLQAMQSNELPGRIAARVVAVLQKFPDLAGQVEMLLEVPSPQLIPLFSQSGVDVAAIKDAEQWIDGLKEAVQARRNEPALKVAAG